ncbi:uncharacterized protein LOC143010133 [Genypterus blacodes]|uniref:uncharacterized protein LOC143010133 n=1 Tax=Genypterus blacodes TaxID=154954 RepID=UPI003F7640F1
MMAEDILQDSFPDLRELESKLGVKTPESLLIWMKNAADCEDDWSSDDHSGALSDKIRILKDEMRWLRSADVRILRQLVSVHEGIEAMRWLMEERGALASRGSSLTGSLTSLVTVEGPGSPVCPCRENLCPTWPEDPDDGPGEESADPPLHNDNNVSNQKNNFNRLIHESAEERPPIPPSSTFTVASSTPDENVVAESSPANPKSFSASFQDIKTNTDPITRALIRSTKVARKDSKRGTGRIVHTKKTGEVKTTDNLPKESVKKEEASVPRPDKSLLDYDAHWCWVESQDDVTFL